ncbi:MAG: Mrp/NBP35 family ATP-binding protein [Bacteroidales bacterium]|nr:Mrp/NBP35 family ATP-binding protein [Bacteroidales bacterium]
MTVEEIRGYLKEVRHPARQDADIVELGLVEDIAIGEGGVVVTLAFPKRKDPLEKYIIGATRAALIRGLGKDVHSEVRTVVKDESPRQQPQGLGTEMLSDVKHIIGVASGKGGVGKSTVAVNLAVALARSGYKVGLADADVYGPSVPVMTGTEGITPSGEKIDGKDYIVPLEKWGVKWMSIGYFAKRGQALIWRGPMASNALKQLILQVNWGELDFLLIDMPPGTGDIHLALVNDIPMQGAIMVTTPQNVALADVEKAADMFRNENIARPIYGVVENMSWFTPAAHPEERYEIFGAGGGQKVAAQLGVPLLSQIPLVQGIREAGDAGQPAALGTGPDAAAFLALASSLASSLAHQQADHMIANNQNIK